MSSPSILSLNIDLTSPDHVEAAMSVLSGIQRLNAFTPVAESRQDVVQTVVPQLSVPVSRSTPTPALSKAAPKRTRKSLSPQKDSRGATILQLLADQEAPITATQVASLTYPGITLSNSQKATIGGYLKQLTDKKLVTREQRMANVAQDNRQVIMRKTWFYDLTTAGRRHLKKLR